LAEHRTQKKSSTALLDNGNISMASPPLIFEGDATSGGKAPAGAFALPSVLKCREAPGRMSLLHF